MEEEPQWYVLGKRRGEPIGRTWISDGPFEIHAEAILAKRRAQQINLAWNVYTIADIRFPPDG